MNTVNSSGLKLVLVYACFVLAPACVDAQSITVPANVTVPTPGLVTVRPTAVDCDDVLWTSLDAGLQLIPPDLLSKREVAVGFVSQPGVYHLRAVCAKAVGGKAVLGVPVDVTVTVGTPTPTDPLAQAIQAAYGLEADPKKAKSVAYFASVCKGMEPKIDAAATVEDLYAVLHTVLHDPTYGYPVGGIPVVERVAGNYLNAQVGTTGPLDKAKAKAAFAALATALGGIQR